eukprot:3586024-Rhodomonas_salina.1
MATNAPLDTAAQQSCAVTKRAETDYALATTSTASFCLSNEKKEEFVNLRCWKDSSAIIIPGLRALLYKYQYMYYNCTAGGTIQFVVPGNYR